jgi:Zn-dependent membrane protease YugP
MIISIKELSKLLGCSDKTGSKIAKEIHELSGVDHITIYHVSDYLKIHPTHLVSVPVLFG